MIVTIHQPNFLPYMGFFDKCDYSDILVLYDSTQYKKNDFQNRNKIRTKDGWIWLTVPASYNFGDLISETIIDNSKNWRKNHIASLVSCYSKSKYFDRYFPKIKKIYSENWVFLVDLNITLIKFFLKELGINCKIVRSSELNLKSKSTDALVEICEKLGGDTYVSGKDGGNYMDTDKFKDFGINVTFQNYFSREYNQVFEGFEKNMCILDLLFNEGPNSLNIIREGRSYEG